MGSNFSDTSSEDMSPFSLLARNCVAYRCKHFLNYLLYRLNKVFIQLCIWKASYGLKLQIPCETPLKART